MQGYTFHVPDYARPQRPVLTLDPGEVSGIAILHQVDGSWILYAGQGTWFDTLRALEHSMIALVPYAPIVVVEAFTITQATARNTPAPWSLEAIGVMRYESRKHGVNDFTTQTATQAKKFADNKKLKAIGWYKATEGGHLNDALRHLVVAMAKRRWLVPPT